MLRDDLVILAVDDDMINLKLLRSMLMKSGKIKEVIEAKNGSDAIDKMKARDDIDLVLLDIIMPIMGGLEVLKIVRADDNLKQVPIIVLTTDETKKGDALEFGANGFLMKPIRKDSLINKILALIV
ncbi:MAG: response regulator [Sulfurimonas sp.]|nr:response regulator [Sulfurimonas sp.]